MSMPSVVPRRRQRERGLPAGLSARPKLATGGVTEYAGRTLGGILERTSARLMRQLYVNIPLFGRALSILSSFAGAPELVGVDDQHTAELKNFTQNVGVGWSGASISPWLTDHIGQFIWHGYGVTEGEVGPDRTSVTRLWSYKSEHFRLNPHEREGLQIIQRNASGPGGGPLILNPLTSKVTTFDPQGSDPYGQPLFLACPTVAQVWVEALQAHKATWRRMGIPIYHLDAPFPEHFTDDEDFTRTKAWLNSLGENLNAAVKSQVERGIAKDFYSAGGLVVKILGIDGISIDFQISKRQLVEELVVASDIPPSLFGYAWSSTERMSSVQMRKLVGRIWAVRTAAEPAIRHLANLHQRLRGETRPYLVVWPHAELTDLVDTSRAALNDALADAKKIEYAIKMWRIGVWDQEDVALFLTESPQVKTPMTEPPALPAESGSEGQSQGDGSREEGQSVN